MRTPTVLVERGREDSFVCAVVRVSLPAVRAMLFMVVGDKDDYAAILADFSPMSGMPPKTSPLTSAVIFLRGSPWATASIV
ncbi:MAG: hypothetical protein ACI9SE_000632 [Neolewinella sp.]|jgi:hypothetical protein